MKKIDIDKNNMPKDLAFVNGMNVQRKNLLQDYNADRVEEQYKKRSPHSVIDVMISVFHNNKNKLHQKINDICSDSDFHLAKSHHFIEYGYRLPSQKNLESSSEINLLEFADGLSNLKDKNKAFELSAAKENYADPMECSYGSYLVYRKMGVDNEYFLKMVKEVSRKLKNNKGDENYAAALLVGRFKNGTPLINFSKQELPENWSKDGTDFPFDYSKDPNGDKCPLHAHVRAVNPRNNGEQKHSPILRRSMIFSDQDILSQTPPYKGNGLLFMSYQKSITDQFEPLFVNMKNNRDAIAYRPNITTNPTCIDLPDEYDQKSRIKGQLEIGGNNLTHLRGGEYFFTPSITFLKSLF